VALGLATHERNAAETSGERLSQTSVAEGRGEPLDADAEDAEPLMAKPAPESPALAEQLMERCVIEAWIPERSATA
jgi:hypothetical protein